VPAVAAGLLSLALCTSPSDLENRAARFVGDQFGRIGRNAPQLDPQLSAAARILAQRALEIGAAEAAKMSSVSEAVSRAEGSDPHPRAFVVRGSPPDQALATFLKRTDLNQDAASRMGIGAQIANNSAAIVALLSIQKAELKPFPRSLAKPRSHELCGKLLLPLQAPKVFVTQPNGQVERVALAQDGPDGFCARIGFPVRGRYSVEVIGQGERGPEVASLFRVAVGPPASLEASTPMLEPKTPAEAKRAILARINSLRSADHLSPLESDPILERVAQGYSERMASENFFAHVSPDGLDLKSRLNKAGYAYQVAGENLGLAAGALAAELSIEQSPGHRRNLLDPKFSRIGIGLATSAREPANALVTEILAQPASAPGADSLEQAYRALEKKRAELHLPPLKRDEDLRQIATEHAQRAVELGQPKAELPGSSLQERLSSLDDVSRTSVEFFVADSPAQVANSQSLSDPRHDRFGIGAVRSDSSKFGRGKYWVVVIYAAARDHPSHSRARR